MPKPAHSSESITLNLITLCRFKSLPLWMDTSIKADSRIVPGFEINPTEASLLKIPS